MYLEGNLEEYLAALNDEYPTTPASTVQLMDLFKLSAPWIRKLHIRRLKCHLDIEVPFAPAAHCLSSTPAEVGEPGWCPLRGVFPNATCSRPCRRWHWMRPLKMANPGTEGQAESTAAPSLPLMPD